ncbi:hypothetical protein PM082_009248 [Marasmius tenuissimus]|nr:hypothetical protein PM082_009248 [Marasmius tenuissimus]
MLPIFARYASTKAAVRSLTWIPVSAYTSGHTDTQLWETIDIALAKMNGLEVGETWKSMEKTVALGRNGDPQDISRLVSFIAGPDSDWITGQTMVVDDGCVFS